MKKLGCAKCGGSMKKMQKGGQMYGIPQTGPTGPNYQGIDTMKKGGSVKKKYEEGGPTDGGRSVRKTSFSTSNNAYDLAGKRKTVSRDGEFVKNRSKTTTTPTSTGKSVTRVTVTKGSGPDQQIRSRRAIIPVKAKKGGSVNFGMLSVKAGVDSNPKPTAADRIAGAKMGKKKMGGSIKKKK